MTGGDWIALASLALSGESVILYGAVKLARIADSVDRLEVAMSRVTGTVEDHERRLTGGGL